MKKTLSIIFLFAIVFSACKRNDYAAQFEQERRDIKKYVAEHYNVRDFSKVPKDSICYYETPENDIYSLGKDSIYIRINVVGDTTKPVNLFDRVQIRYIETTLDGTRTESYWTILDLLDPLEVIFGNVPPSGTQTNANCAGWQTAIRLMKYSEAESEIIVPSKLGVYKNSFPVLTPCHYKFTFKLKPR